MRVLRNAVVTALVAGLSLLGAGASYAVPPERTVRVSVAPLGEPNE